MAIKTSSVAAGIPDGLQVAAEFQEPEPTDVLTAAFTNTVNVMHSNSNMNNIFLSIVDSITYNSDFISRTCLTLIPLKRASGGATKSCG